jgi:hypothetical protein
MRGPFSLDAVGPKTILRHAAEDAGILSRPAGLDVIPTLPAFFFSNALSNACGVRSRGQPGRLNRGFLLKVRRAHADASPAFGPVEHEVGRHSTCIDLLPVPPAAASVMGDTAVATAGHHFPGMPLPPPTARVAASGVPRLTQKAWQAVTVSRAGGRKLGGSDGAALVSRSQPH